ncbi:MAG TPA: carboxymuconolactone decarboxylase family protein [Polyangiaceae bacterium]|nr:carboxymuconolactone decarboxylase family protein [Polyangiaceae bacterium]
MRLRGVARGHGVAHRLKLGVVRVVSGGPPSDVVRLLLYRSELFGAPLRRYIHAALRGPSEWTAGERELFATFVSQCNRCAFCTAAHRAVAERALGDRVVRAALDDWRSAPVSGPVRTALGLLERLCRAPEAVGEAELRQAIAGGVSPEGLENVLHIAAVFNVINRVADALGFDVPPPAVFAHEAETLLRLGYDYGPL